MATYIRVVEDECDLEREVIELPVEPDGTMLLSTLTAQFPCASGLKYRNPGTQSLRGLRVVEGRIQPPDEVWGDHLYIAVFPKDNKRKGEDSSENNSSNKTRRVENKTVDLIVLGLAWKTTVASMREYFEKKFGEVLMCEIKKNLDNQSKGFGFVRFKDYKVQCLVVSQRHNIDGRYCDVKIPDSKNSQDSKKMFVGRMPQDMTKEDLYNYFSKYGEVTDVYIPKPYRCFGFVTFLRSDVASIVASEDHIYKGTSLQVNRAEPKNPKLRMQGDDHHSGYGYGGGYSDKGRYYSRGDYPQGGRGRGRGGGGGGGGGKMGSRDNYRDRDQGSIGGPVNQINGPNVGGGMGGGMGGGPMGGGPMGGGAMGGAMGGGAMGGGMGGNPGGQGPGQMGNFPWNQAMLAALSQAGWGMMSNMLAQGMQQGMQQQQQQQQQGNQQQVPQQQVPQVQQQQAPQQSQRSQVNQAGPIPNQVMQTPSNSGGYGSGQASLGWGSGQSSVGDSGASAYLMGESKSANSGW